MALKRLCCQKKQTNTKIAQRLGCFAPGPSCMIHTSCTSMLIMSLKRDIFRDRHLICITSTLRREKRELRQQRNPRSHRKSLVVGWIPTILLQTKYFGRPSAVYVAKNRVSLTPSRILQVTFYNGLE